MQREEEVRATHAALLNVPLEERLSALMVSIVEDNPGARDSFLMPFKKAAPRGSFGLIAVRCGDALEIHTAFLERQIAPHAANNIKLGIARLIILSCTRGNPNR
jgi:hypothetical protein